MNNHTERPTYLSTCKSSHDTIQTQQRLIDVTGLLHQLIASLPNQSSLLVPVVQSRD